MSNDSPELAAWKAKHGLTEINDNNEHEIRMAAEEAQSTKKLGALGATNICR